MELFFVIFIFLIFSILVGKLGEGRKIGFVTAFFLSLFLSPLIGLLITLLSERKTAGLNYNKGLNVTQNKQIHSEKTSDTEKIKTISNVSEELKKIKELFENGVINEEEFSKIKSILIESIYKFSNSNETIYKSKKNIIINSHVVELKTGIQYRVIEIINNIFICAPSSNPLDRKSFREDEIELFSTWVETYNKFK
ncbi:MAG: SHOCT domain-containing protein [Firmicutes bacterium]|nr:SHOCT domain-containing protein [Bacillota bacterium]